MAPDWNFVRKLALCLLLELASPNLSTVVASLIGYNQVVKCATENDPTMYTFNNYGCYCGGGNISGQLQLRAVDDIDKCCQNHNLCYDMLVDRFLCTKLTRYTDAYEWLCLSSENQAQDASYAPFMETIQAVFNDTISRKQNKFPVCQRSKSYCGISLCYCDVQAALCFAKCKNPITKATCGDKRIIDKEAK